MSPRRAASWSLGAPVHGRQRLWRRLLPGRGESGGEDEEEPEGTLHGGTLHGKALGSSFAQLIRSREPGGYLGTDLRQLW